MANTCKPRRSSHRLTVIFWSLALLPAGVTFAETQSGEIDSSQVPAVAVAKSRLEINGFVSLGYNYNFNDPRRRLNDYRVFDYRANSLSLDVAELVLQVPVSERNDVGFRFDVAVGNRVPKVAASSGLFRDEVTGEAENYDLQQFFGSWNTPIGKGVRVDIGKFMTHVGAEVVEGYDGFNDNYTRGFLFGYAIPFAHTGVRASYSFSSKLSGMVMLAQGWDNFTDNNSGKTYGAQLIFNVSPEVTLYTNTLSGPEQADNVRNKRSLIDLIGVFKLSDRFTVTLNYDAAKEQRFDGVSNARWSGVAIYGRYNVSDRFAISSRYEQFEDKQGFRTGVSQRLREWTITNEYRFGPQFLVRGDLRRDSSDHDVFQKQASLSSNQSTVSLNGIYRF
ncbi:MAG: porin [Acidobacteriota bacterium]